MTAVPGIRLDGGVTIPQLGFGVWQIEPDVTAEMVTSALAAGYRHFDTAKVYGNEDGVGQGIEESGIAREDVFVTTKLFKDDLGHDQALRAIDASLGRLGMDYVDLYLIHWPWPSIGKQVETWKAMIEIRNSGKVRAIGVSNFREQDLREIIDATGVVPAVNQIEMHPSFQQLDLRATHAELGIVTEAWSPLGVGKDLNLSAVQRIAADRGVSPARVILRWHIQLGNVVFPKSGTPTRIQENFDIFDFELSVAEMSTLAEADTGVRQGWDPAGM